jgi:hypothetical protein
MRKITVMGFIFCALVMASQGAWATTYTEGFNFVDRSSPNGWFLDDDYQALLSFNFLTAGNTATYQVWHDGYWKWTWGGPVYVNGYWETLDTASVSPDVTSMPAGATPTSATLSFTLWDGDNYSEHFEIQGLGVDSGLAYSQDLNFNGSKVIANINALPQFSDFVLNIQVTDCGETHNLYLQNATLVDDCRVNTVPEPGSLILLGSGLLGLGVIGQRKYGKKNS